MLQAQDAQEQPFSGGNEAAVAKKAPRRLFSNVPVRQFTNGVCRTSHAIPSIAELFQRDG
jgi:hypothetical protein